MSTKRQSVVKEMKEAILKRLGDDEKDDFLKSFEKAENKYTFLTWVNKYLDYQIKKR